MVLLLVVEAVEGEQLVGLLTLSRFERLSGRPGCCKITSVCMRARGCL